MQRGHAHDVRRMRREDDRHGPLTVLVFFRTKKVAVDESLKMRVQMRLRFLYCQKGVMPLSIRDCLVKSESLEREV